MPNTTRTRPAAVRTDRKKTDQTPAPTATARTKRPSTRPAAVDGPAGAAKSGAEDKVRPALLANPGSTPAEIALAAGVARSTATRILAGWERDGTATRTPGVGAVNGGRAPDLWTAADHVPGDTTSATATAPSPEPAVGPPTPVGATAARVAAGPTRSDDPNRTVTMSGDRRLGKNALRGLVAAHLAAHPDQEFSPTMLSRVLSGRSAGAIYNALVKLVAAGEAIETCPAPRRYAIAPATSGTTSTAPSAPPTKATKRARKPGAHQEERSATPGDSTSSKPGRPTTKRAKAD